MNLHSDFLGDLNESTIFVDSLCMECDAGWVGDPSISVDEADGTGQANFIAGLVVANIGAHRLVCTR